MLITGAAMVVVTILSLAFQARQMTREMAENLRILAGAVSQLGPIGYEYNKDTAADEILSVLSEDDTIELGLIYDRGGEIFGVYQKRKSKVKPELPLRLEYEGHRFFLSDGFTFNLEVFHPVVRNGKQIGTMYVRANLHKLKTQIYKSLLLLSFSMAIILFVAQFTARRLQRMITAPVYDLANTVRQISELGDYTVRVERKSGDEIGDLIDDFNRMLDAIEIRDSELHQHRHNLELIVEERTEELTRRRDEALKAAQAKTEFLANMSHEIRTPMNGVIGVLSLLKSAPLSDEFRRLLETATRSADSLMFIINDILDFSKIDAGMVEFESIPFDLRELMEETIALFVDAVNSQDIDLMCFVPSDVHCYVNGDPTRLRQILTNLVSNAVKFTRKGEVVVRAEPIEKHKGKQLLRFSVKDSGIGISKDALPQLFDKFTQADGSTTRKYGGTGLGLSVCKQLVELQGGDIGVESRVNEGAEFWFTLPLMQVPASDVSTQFHDLRQKRVLIVDDSATNQMILQHYLQDCLSLPVLASSAEQALACCADAASAGEFFDILLVDHHMPGTDGLQLATEIGQLYGDAAPAIYLLTSGSISPVIAEDLGLSGVIFKPVRRSQLFDVLTQRSPHPAEEIKTSTSDELADQFSGKILLVDDEQINQKVACAILEKFGLNVDLASTGLEAVRMTDKNWYDLILMDIQMPEMSGFDATEVIRKRELKEEREPCVIVAMTANALETTRQHCINVGMNDFISKPIKPEALLKRIRPWITAEKPADQMMVREVSLPAKSGSSWDCTRALAFVGGDQRLLRDMAALFLTRKDLLLQNVHQAVEASDAELLDDAAHALKGAVNHFAADELISLAYQLEVKGKEGNLTGSREIFKRLQYQIECLAEELDLVAQSEELNV